MVGHDAILKIVARHPTEEKFGPSVQLIPLCVPLYLYLVLTINVRNQFLHG